MARFLLDYCSKEDVKPHVEFEVIAGYFLRYYWAQICKLKMKHAPQTRKKPEIVKIIEKAFPEPYYPQTFDEIKQKQPKKIQSCINAIIKRCFHNVTWRFQRVKVNRAAEIRLYFDYKIAKTVNENKKYVELSYGINLNPQAISFFKRRHAVLLKAVILEWAKFLEKLNTGLPKLIAKTEGSDIKRGNLAKYKQNLKPLFCYCFYCKQSLVGEIKIEVEHVIPFAYIAEDDIWNLTLACKKCNCEKLGALPPIQYIEKLIRRNKIYRKQIPGLEKSLTRLDSNFESIIKNHYENAKSQGYMSLKVFPKIKDSS